jgi:hypothetical protein
MTIDARDKRFGVIAVEKGFITKENLFEALKIQVEDDLSDKPHCLIGQILIRLGHLNREQADEVLLVMRKTLGPGDE